MRKASRPALLVILLLALFGSADLYAERLASPTWGFAIELPEGYELTGGDSVNRFAFRSEAIGAGFDLAVYEAGKYASARALAADAMGRLKAKGDRSEFDYRGHKAVLMQLSFSTAGEEMTGWGLCVELDPREGSAKRPLLIALAYGEGGDDKLSVFHLSALDSITPSDAERRAPGPVNSFTHPSTGILAVRISGIQSGANIDKSDKEASNAVVERESRILACYAGSPLADKAWARYYRMIWKDAYDRLSDVAFAVGQDLQGDKADSGSDRTALARVFANSALHWVQRFHYERDPEGTDFVDPVTAATEGRGDCDSRALLLAIILQHNNIRASMMVSGEFSHAMGLVDIAGEGGRFPLADTQWLVAETTAKVEIGKIAKEQSELSKWMGINLE